MSERWQFHKFFGSPNVQQEIFEFWGMGRSPKRQSKSWNKKRIKETKNNKQGFNRDFARHLSAWSVIRKRITNRVSIRRSHGVLNLYSNTISYSTDFGRFPGEFPGKMNVKKKHDYFIFYFAFHGPPTVPSRTTGGHGPHFRNDWHRECFLVICYHDYWIHLLITVFNLDGQTCKDEDSRVWDVSQRSWQILKVWWNGNYISY